MPDPRSTALEKVAFGLAIAVAPLGLLASIVAAAISVRRRGWVQSLVSAGIVIASVITLLAAGGLIVGDSYAAEAIRQRTTEARTQPMCRAIRTNGLDATGADFGWPDPGESIDATVASIRAYADRWRSVQAVAPAAVRPAVSSIVGSADEIASAVGQSRTVSDADNTARFQGLRGQSTLPRWVAVYCS